ncbi:beta-lactamase family protein [Nanchangia anserum]|uniref:Beta-lactamase family protein n=1 Tax=Nanchangia anserum TaxID=2692125 RepID=A0A8I0KPZ4_9ACTO|nr:serine hydrolase domain-containing protein [Nanchangia anserum]MBD3689420.1 beta-lactamase family protein [Nanchangia anserum]QOX81626.1 beta-lactamase family protein [Nanchangia anserum]
MSRSAALPQPLQRAIEQWHFPVALAVLRPEATWMGGDVDTEYPWMSVTKLVTARVALDAVASGLIDLDDTVTQAGASLEMVLAHAAGLSPEGEQVCEPGTRRIYSNAGYEVIGQHVEAAHRGVSQTGGIGDLLCEAVATWGGAVSYEKSPAWGLSGSLASLAALTRELAWPRHIDAELWRLATRPAWPGLPGILPGYGPFDDNAWGLGPEIRAAKHPHWTAARAPATVFGHFGQSGSFVWVDQDADLAACFLSSRRFGLAHQRAWPDLNAEIYRHFAG